MRGDPPHMPTIPFENLEANIAGRIRNVKAGLPDVAFRVGEHVKNEAVKNAPMSPTQEQSDKLRVMKGKDGTREIVKRSGEEIRKLKKRRAKLRATLRREAKSRDMAVFEEAFNSVTGNRKQKASQKKLIKEMRKKHKRVMNFTRPAPGGLRKSISNDVTTQGDNVLANIFVASNSDAMKYARRIHDERYKTWKNLGVKSRTMGERVREKFISRAVHDTQTNAKVIGIIKAKLKDTKATT